jgi:hypothetical protein
MSSMPESVNEEIVTAAQIALTCFHPADAEQAGNMLLFWVRRQELTHLDVAEVLRRMFPESAPACPDWCTIDHATDDERDDLVLHMGDDHIDGVGRKLLDGKLDIRVARCDDTEAGTRGVPNLYVRADLELTTWEQAAELARAILDGFGYLNGAEQR